MEVFDAISGRYSVRNYSARPVEDEKLQAVLEAGRLAPTAKNQQPQKIFVYRSEKALAKIRSVAPMTFNAPVVLLICSDNSEAATGFSGRCFGETDVSIVTDHMMLRAYDLGLGSCWIGWFDQNELKAGLGLAENLVPWHILLLGYTADGYVPSPKHSDRKPLSETVTEM